MIVSKEQTRPRSRAIWLSLTFVTMGLGLCSRKFAAWLPAVAAEHSGDALWALMVFFGFGVLFPRISTIKCAISALTFAYLIEFSQTLQWPWLQRLSEDSIARLILGQGFLWIDLLRYAGLGRSWNESFC